MRARDRRPRAVARAAAVDLERERRRITRWMAASLAALLGSWALAAAAR